MDRARRSLLALALLAALTTSGCLDLQAARVPDRVLTNGWARNLTASQDEPSSTSMGFVKTQTLVYEKRGTYAGTVSVTTLRTLLRPSEETLRDTVEPRVRDEATAKGIRMQAGSTTGTREVASGADAYWFVQDGSVETPGFFARSAEVKVFGEVFQCPEQRTAVVTVALAQTTDVRTIGGVPLPSDPDLSTWREIVADPRGRIEGWRGQNGLAYNVAC